MGKSNIERNRKRFEKNIRYQDESILGGCVDGIAYIINRYDQTMREAETGNKQLKKDERHMTLIPTDKRIVVYQSKSMLSVDNFAQLPLTEIDEITRVVLNRKNGAGKNGNEYVCVVEFIAPDDSTYPSIIFKFDSEYEDDPKQFDAILQGISKLSGVPIDDLSDMTPKRNATAQQQTKRPDNVMPTPQFRPAQAPPRNRPPQVPYPQQQSNRANQQNNRQQNVPASRSAQRYQQPQQYAPRNTQRPVQAYSPNQRQQRR